MKTVVRRMLIKAQAGALAGALVGASVAMAPPQGFAATAQESTALEKVERGFSIGFDLVVLRPLGAGRMFVGMGFLVPMSIFNTLRMPFEQNTAIYRESAELLVIEPANFVFRRPLGEDFSGE